MTSVLDTQTTGEQSTPPKQDLGYLKRRRFFDEFLPRARDEKRDPLDRLEDILALLGATQLYEDAFTAEIAELTKLRDEMKRSLNIL